MIYHVYANRSNIGDWLSAKGIQKILHPLPITECLCDTPFVGETMQKLSMANEDDLIVIGGGGLIMDYFLPFWKSFATVAERVPFVIWGIGSCNLKYETTLPPLQLIEEIIIKSRLCIVRDELTKTLFTNVSLPDPVPCPSINFIEPFPIQIEGILHIANYTTAGAVTYSKMRAHAIQYSEENGIIFRETNNRIEKDRKDEMEHVLLRYKKSNIAVSSALHGCIISLAMGLKTIAVSGDTKIDEFMKDIGLEEWVLDVNEVDRLPEMLQKINEQETPTNRLLEIKNTNSKIGEKIKEMFTYNLQNI